ncbi:MAG: IS630 family transposase [Flavisolibacter sp.]|nr:IS630 family transposase [Flavisolibacter sp.]
MAGQRKEAGENNVGHSVSDDSLCAMLHPHGWLKKAPRAEHPKAGEVKHKREAFKKVPELLEQPTAGAKPLQVFFEDEARFGRISNPSGCWVPKAKRAAIEKHMITEPIYSFSAVCPLQAESYSLIAPLCHTAAMNELLQALSIAYAKEAILVFADSAGWHQRKELQTPANIHWQRLPPYSAERNPTEHLCDYIREQKGFNNHTFDALDALENHLEKVLKELHQQKQYIPSLCTFNWMINTS